MFYSFGSVSSLLLVLLLLLLVNVSTLNGQFNASLGLKCDFSEVENATSSYSRATTQQCKDQIENAVCFHKAMETIDFTLKYRQIKTKCPLILEKRMQLTACLAENEMDLSLLEEDDIKFSIKNDIAILNEEYCVDYCLTFYGYEFAAFNSKSIGNQLYNRTCICIQSLPSQFKLSNDNNCKNLKKNEEKAFFIYTTGVLVQDESMVHNSPTVNINQLHQQMFLNKKPKKIMFFFILSIDSYERQIYRLLKNIYSPNHLYYFHIDAVISFLLIFNCFEH
jgi:hypothetical protein